MGRTKGSGKPWQFHFEKYVIFQNDGHWIWRGRLNSHKKNRKPLPVFSVRADEHKMLNKTATWWAYWYRYETQKPDLGRKIISKNICGVDLCINPEHQTNCSPEKVRPNAERDDEIIELYTNHLKWRKFTMTVIGQKYGISRARVQQIIREKLGTNGH